MLFASNEMDPASLQHVLLVNSARNGKDTIGLFILCTLGVRADVISGACALCTLESQGSPSSISLDQSLLNCMEYHWCKVVEADTFGFPRNQRSRASCHALLHFSYPLPSHTSTRLVVEYQWGQATLLSLKVKDQKPSCIPTHASSHSFIR